MVGQSVINYGPWGSIHQTHQGVKVSTRVCNRYHLYVRKGKYDLGRFRTLAVSECLQ